MHPDHWQWREWVEALSRNLHGGARLGLLRPVTAGDFILTAEALATLVVLNLIAMFLLGFANVGVNGEPNLAELPRALLYVPLTLAFGLLVARSTGMPALMLLLSVALVAAGTLISIALGIAGLLLQHVLPALQRHWEILVIGGIAWWCAVVIAAVAYLAHATLRQTVGHAAAGFALLVAPVWLLPQGALWVAAHDPEAAGRARAGFAALAEEQAFYAQHEALRDALEALAPERPGIADLYVLAAGLYSREDVFMKEVQGIVELFRSRFDAAGRTLALINNPKTVEQHPVASLTSLSTALRHLGTVMNVEEDALVLYLSSHGSDNHQLLAEFWPLRLAPIDPPALKRALDDSGIKWKIVVVSACYSGGFVEPLKDDRTLIITASSANRQSFGCGNESDSTYLARALFDEQLRRTYSFEAAFAAARETIAQRERAQGHAPSEPQIFVGAAIRDKLKDIERRLEARARP